MMQKTINIGAVLATAATVAGYMAQACSGFPPIALQALSAVAGILLWLSHSPLAGKVEPPVQ